MRRWYSRLPIHRQLVAVALMVTTAALIFAIGGLIAVDLWRYRSVAAEDTAALAGVIAENTAAAVTFRDPDDAAAILATMGVRPAVRRGCLYLDTGPLFARYERTAEFPCPPTLDLRATWRTVIGTAAIVRNDRRLGAVYVERELTELWATVAVALGAGLGMLVVAGIVAVPIANRLNRRISRPIAQLSAAARSVGTGAGPHTLPAADTGSTEINNLVDAFSDMLRRVADANEALRRKETEREDLLVREREANRLKDEFLAAVSHELRTPLSAILGWTDVLTMSAPTEQVVARAVPAIARNARAQARMIEDLVDVSRIVAGKMTLRTAPLDLREVVDAGVDAARLAAGARNIAITLRAASEGCAVIGDRDRLQQVVANLLSNAIKFSAEGSTIQVTVQRVDGACEVIVKDDGAGIPAEFLAHVFEPFRQADGTTTRRHGGLGLGLAIVRQIVALHGGTVKVDSDGRDKGTTATFRLRALATAGDAVRLDADEGAVQGTPLAGVRVALVDDNLDVLEVLGAGLTAAGAEVHTAPSGEMALRAMAEQPPDVLVCDLAMPGIDGFEVLRRMRSGVGAVSRVPAIALSAHATAEHREQSRSSGFREHLVKPCPLDAVVQAIIAARVSPAGGEPTNGSHSGA